MLWLLVQLRSALVVLSTRLDLAVTNAACVGLLRAGGESNELCTRCSLAVSFCSVFNYQPLVVGEVRLTNFGTENFNQADCSMTASEFDPDGAPS